MRSFLRSQFWYQTANSIFILYRNCSSVLILSVGLFSYLFSFICIMTSQIFALVNERIDVKYFASSYFPFLTFLTSFWHFTLFFLHLSVMFAIFLELFFTYTHISFLWLNSPGLCIIFCNFFCHSRHFLTFLTSRTKDIECELLIIKCLFINFNCSQNYKNWSRFFVTQRSRLLLS